MTNKIEYVSPEMEVTFVEDDILTFSLENETHFMPGVDGEDDNG
jgi:hypothetical protein